MSGEENRHFCPGCGTVMWGNHCKLKCPKCGFFEDCSDGVGANLNFKEKGTVPLGTVPFDKND